MTALLFLPSTSPKGSLTSPGFSGEELALLGKKEFALGEEKKSLKPGGNRSGGRLGLGRVCGAARRLVPVEAAVPAAGLSPCPLPLPAPA